jgi:peptide/nickel transport system substrate-binding protein
MAVAAMMAIITTTVGCSGSLDVLDRDDGDEQVTATTTTGVPRPGGRLVYAIESDPNGLNPTTNAWDNSAIQLANALYDPLVAFDDTGATHPYLAESLTPSADQRTWTIKLRPDVVFTSGDPLDADALVTFMDALRRSAITGPPAQMISGVRAVNPLTVEVTMSRPWATFPALMAGQGGYVVSPRQLAAADGHSNPDGTGPFLLRDWEQDRRFELVRNPRYWRAGLPYLDAVVFEVVYSGADRLELLIAGDIDATHLTTPPEIARVDKLVTDPAQRGRVTVQSDPGDTEKTVVVFNTTRPPLDDVRVRRAIAHATDTEALADQMGWSPELRASGPFSPTSAFFTEAAYPAHDPDKARALIQEYLSDTRVPNRRRQISFALTGAGNGLEAMQGLIEQWREVGIEAEVDLRDVKQLVRFAVIGDYDAMVLRYFAAPDPDVLWHFFVEDTIPATGVSLNFARLRDREISSGMTAGRSSADPSVRKRAYAKVQHAFAEQVPYLWINRSEWRVVSGPRVRDARNVTLPDGRGALPLVAGTHRLTETWIER